MKGKCGCGKNCYTDFENLVIERTSDIPWIGNRNEVTKIIFLTYTNKKRNSFC